MNRKYDYIVVGCGLSGATFARRFLDARKKVLVIDRKPFIGGAAYTENMDGVDVHMYGAHIFHTKSKRIWDFITKFGEFNTYQHRVKAITGRKIYPLPFNMMTFHMLWGCTTIAEAKAEIERQKVEIENPQNLEEWVLSQLGPEIYQKFIYHYTKKQWGREPKLLPPSIIKRIPIRFDFNDNYFDDQYQGIPVDGYTKLVEKMIDGADLMLGMPLSSLGEWQLLGGKLVYTGSIDEYFGYRYGKLEFRSINLSHKKLPESCYGVPVLNHTDNSMPYTRMIEHRFFNPKSKNSVISTEFPADSGEPYYPIPNTTNTDRYNQYYREIAGNGYIIGGGRLFNYQYLNMDQVVGEALAKADAELKNQIPRE